MVTYNILDIQKEIEGYVDNMPDAISKRIMSIATGKLDYVKKFTGQDINSNSISEEIKDIVVLFTTAQVLNFMNIQGADADSIKLGDFTIKKGGVSNVLATAKSLREQAEKQLKEQGRGLRFMQTFT